MAKDLVIVESPAKARTVARFLGPKYEAKASMGHVRDLPRGEMGVEVDDSGFHPTYAIMPDKRKVVAELAKASKAADTVYLATDPDREGEAISWHLINAAKIDKSKVKRVVFHEITRQAIEEAFANPRELDQDLIDAQQARRILDRLVGYRLSPVLWGKVRRGLSAGRVQSVALRMVVDREREIHVFVPVEYWSIEAVLAKSENGRSPEFKAALHSIKGEKGEVSIPNGERANEITADLDDADFAVDSVRKREAHSRPSPPFITSTLQQEASRKLRFSGRRTMQVAQQLYEGLSIGNEGSVGLITYMRTDSTNVASSALSEAAGYIRKRFGDQYAPKSPRKYTKKVRGAQEAHEAIRPTSIAREPETVRQHLSPEQFRLYDLVWKRMLASQMADALFDSTTVDITAPGKRSDSVYVFRVKGSVLKFPGFRVLYMEDRDDASADGDQEETAPLPDLAKGDALDLRSLTPEQHFTQPPPRYSEPTLIKEMEEQGIGRPSTYVPIIGTIMARDYVRKEKGRFVPTKLGTAVTGLLTTHFPDVMDIGFTARVEEELDDIASGEREWTPVLRDFYGPFDEAIERAMRDAERVPRDQIDEETDEVCEKCERPMVIKTGRYGRFLSCSGFPECRNSRPLLARVGVECPECGGDLVERRQKGKGRRTFYGCSNYPTCNFAVNRRPLPQPCPECSKLLLTSGRDRAQCTSCDYHGPVPEEEPVEIAV
ncbi:MAG: type I DNA topoisomerase [Chloroflexi bacterium]|nr:type I DNA topoisomerase [Chloroflexota bacterium]